MIVIRLGPAEPQCGQSHFYLHGVNIHSTCHNGSYARYDVALPRSRPSTSGLVTDILEHEISAIHEESHGVTLSHQLRQASLSITIDTVNNA
jgi:hypothetical protein